jgi:hypothetical protein
LAWPRGSKLLIERKNKITLSRLLHKKRFLTDPKLAELTFPIIICNQIKEKSNDYKKVPVVRL